ncbi:diiron oxygenase [Nocardia australiensis]|uniref:diiron oxygenase n=1 Tax=Nocardia australiensis TaxID=2887191 RepID=UPI001D15D848|nr:diiron oxygenase [Nocardia australiensis]
MCGTTGLFIGCERAPTCARRLILDSLTVEPDVAENHPYRSPFATWHDRASVRRAPRRVVQRPSADAFYFDPELVPVATHPLVARLPRQNIDELLIRHLYRYLRFTEYLETLVVNHTALGLAMGTVLPGLPRQMRDDAYHVYCDEAYHAQFSADLINQVEQLSGVDAPQTETPHFMVAFEQLVATHEPADRPLLELLFVIVSETLITGTLASVPANANMPAAVTQAVRDHAIDEGRHHTYFGNLLSLVWAAMPPDQISRVGPAIPKLIRCFLAPATEVVARDLMQVGVTGPGSVQVIADTFRPDLVDDQIRIAAHQTIRHFKRAGALDAAIVEDCLHRDGFL